MGKVWEWMSDERRRTLVMVNLAGVMERADEALLPGVYREIGIDLHMSPTQLGSLTLLRSITQALCYPLAAYMATNHNRAHVIAVGAFLWAAATFMVGISTTIAEVAVSRALNGIGLAMVVPAIASMVADCAHENERGMAFGWLQFTSGFGSIFGSVFSVLVSSTTVLGIQGWRFSFHLIAGLSIIVGLMVRAFAVDPHFRCPTSREQMRSKKSILEGMKDMISDSKKVISIPTFQIIIAQGVMGSFPWSAMAFVPMWLEMMGFSHSLTALLLTIFTAACSLGGLIGGKMGDVLAIKFPNSGRIVVSQISSTIFVPMSAILVLGLPSNPSTISTIYHGLIFFIMGLAVSWNSAATNSPIFAEIVPERSRTNVYALDRTFESILASFAPPIVGILAQRLFGFNPKLTGSTQSADEKNAKSLAKALYTAMGIPMTICVLIYTFLYRTYPRDRDAARAESQMMMVLEELQSDGDDAQSELELQKFHNNNIIDVEVVTSPTMSRNVHDTDDEMKRLL